MAVYILHLDVPLHHARHYVGFSTNERTLQERIEHHRRGTAKCVFTRVLMEKGITFTLARVFRGERFDRTFERKLKRHIMCRSTARSAVVKNDPTNHEDYMNDLTKRLLEVECSDAGAAIRLLEFSRALCVQASYMPIGGQLPRGIEVTPITHRVFLMGTETQLSAVTHSYPIEAK